jgi:hypothetical protein
MSILDGNVIVMTSDKIAETNSKVEEVRVANNNLVKKALTTTANGATTLFNYTGNIRIKAIYGIVTTIMETKTQNCKLSVKSDALADYDICANKDLSAVDVGTLISITGTAANAAVATTVVGAIAPFQASEVIATSITSGLIKVTQGASNTGAITWYMQWEPLSEGATVTTA